MKCSCTESCSFIDCFKSIGPCCRHTACQRRHWVEEDCWKFVQTHSLRPATAMPVVTLHSIFSPENSEVERCLTLRKYCVDADCWKEMPTHSTRSATAMSSSMRSYTVSGVMT